MKVSVDRIRTTRVILNLIIFDDQLRVQTNYHSIIRSKKVESSIIFEEKNCLVKMLSKQRGSNAHDNPILSETHKISFQY